MIYWSSVLHLIWQVSPSFAFIFYTSWLDKLVGTDHRTCKCLPTLCLKYLLHQESIYLSGFVNCEDILFAQLTLGEWGNSIYAANLNGYWRDANLPPQIRKREGAAGAGTLAFIHLDTDQINGKRGILSACLLRLTYGPFSIVFLCPAFATLYQRIVMGSVLFEVIWLWIMKRRCSCPDDSFIINYE